MTEDEWHQAERDIVRAWTTGDRPQALTLIDRVLARGSDVLRGRALLYRGSIREEEANWAAARRDFMESVGLLPAGSYVRYTAELSVAIACKRLGEESQAVDWYRAALMSCAAGEERFSGAAAAKGLMALEPVPRPVDQDLIRAVIISSWQLLRLPGEPDLEDLVGAIETLMKRQSGR